MVLNPEEILEEIKAGKSYLLDEDVNLLGETDYEEHLFYIPKRNIFCRHQVDWLCYFKSNWKKANSFEEIDEEEALILIRLKLEQDEDDKP